MTLDFLLKQQRKELDELFKKEKFKYFEEIKTHYDNGKLVLKNKKETLTILFLNSHIMKIEYKIYDEYLNYLLLTQNINRPQNRIRILTSYDKNIEIYNFNCFEYVKNWKDLGDFFVEKQLQEDKPQPLLFTKNNIKYTIQLFNYFLKLQDITNETMA